MKKLIRKKKNYFLQIYLGFLVVTFLSFGIEETKSVFLDVEKIDNNYSASELDLVISEEVFSGIIGVDELDEDIIHVESVTVETSESSIDTQYGIVIDTDSISSEEVCDAVEVDVSLNGNQLYSGKVSNFVAYPGTEFGDMDFEFYLSSEADPEDLEEKDSCQFDLIAKAWSSGINTFTASGFYDIDTLSFDIAILFDAELLEPEMEEEPFLLRALFVPEDDQSLENLEDENLNEEKEGEKKDEQDSVENPEEEEEDEIDELQGGGGGSGGGNVEDEDIDGDDKDEDGDATLEDVNDENDDQDEGNATQGDKKEESKNDSENDENDEAGAVDLDDENEVDNDESDPDKVSGIDESEDTEDLEDDFIEEGDSEEAEEFDETDAGKKDDIEEGEDELDNDSVNDSDNDSDLEVDSDPEPDTEPEPVPESSGDNSE